MEKWSRFLVIFIMISTSCKGVEKKINSTYTLKKTSNWLNENDPNFLIYTMKRGDNVITFYTKGNYGVLENYNEDNSDLSRFLVFSTPKNLGEELKISENDALFEVESDILKMDYSEASELLDNYFFIALRGDPSYQEFVIVDVAKQTTSVFGTHGDFEVSADQHFLFGWEDAISDKGESIVCPEKKEEGYYVVTEQFKYELSTGKKATTGLKGCGLIQ